jgi:MFS family permease
LSDHGDTGSAWSPLSNHVFRALWIAAIFSNIGTWMQNVGGVWLMTTLTTSPLMVALMQTATSLPVFLVVLPAGALADIVDRRRMLLLTQGWMFLASVGLTALTLHGEVAPWALLGFTFALGLGSAMNMPAWQVVVPGLVSTKELPAAVALNSVSFNIARAVGPALGGAIVAYSGPAAVFLLNAVSFLGVIAVLFRWKKADRETVLPPEHIVGAIRAGTRYAANAPDLRAVLLRCLSFVVFSSALWALMPLVARQELGMGSTGFGALLGCIGGGALVGAALMPRIRRRMSVDASVMAGSLVFALATFAMAYLRNEIVLYVMMGAAGLAWITVMATLNVSTQTIAPSWVRARAMGFYTLAFQGGMAVASALWGTVTSYTSTSMALLCAGCGLCLLPALTRTWKLTGTMDQDLSPAHRWVEPHLFVEPEPQAGPVLVMLEYRIDVGDSADFSRAMHQLGRIRKRDGAMRWRLYRDLSDPGRYLELFVLESWAEHLRQRSRMTVADQAIKDRALSFHKGESPPVVSHLIHEPNLGDA